MFENWTYSLYYILAELWGSAMLALIFWQSANQIFSIKQAKKVYPLFGLFGQVGMLMSDNVTTLFTDKDITKNWQESLNIINITVFLSGLLLSMLYFLLCHFIANWKDLNASMIKKKKKINFVQSLRQITKSKYLAMISIIILCYGISINLIEGVWKAQARLLYVDQQSYAAFMAKLQGYTGKISMITMGVGSYVLTITSWYFSALITPVAIFVSGTIFYIFSIYKNSINIFIPSIVIATVAGFIQNVTSKATKYAFFDATKEIAYIPLDEELKSKGKAAAEIIGGRLGKSGGAIIQWFLISLTGMNLINISMILFVIFIFIMTFWFLAVSRLAKEFNRIDKISKTKK
jgi:AAA family ATP:ADP antiporter